MKAVIYKVQANGHLVRVASQDVPDTTAADKVESTAWSLYTRNHSLGVGSYEVHRAGRGYDVYSEPAVKTRDKGPIA